MPTTTPENASDLYKSQITDIAVPSPANKAAAVLLTPINGKQIFVNGSDGGWFTGVTGLPLSTLTDNGGASCGTEFIPTGGDGSAGWRRPEYVATLPEWFGTTYDGTTDDALSILNMFNAIRSASGGIVEFPKDGTVLASYGWRIPDNCVIKLNGCTFNATTTVGQGTIPTNGYDSGFFGITQLNTASPIAATSGNVTILGSGSYIDCRREVQTGTPTGFMGVVIKTTDTPVEIDQFNLKNIIVKDLIINRSGFDGVYVAGGKNVEISNVISQYSLRIGHTVVSGEDVTFNNCFALYSIGENPNEPAASRGPVNSGDGFWNEPNNAWQELNNIKYNFCTAKYNYQSGFKPFNAGADCQFSIELNHPYSFSNVYDYTTSSLRTSSGFGQFEVNLNDTGTKTGLITLKSPIADTSWVSGIILNRGNAAGLNQKIIVEDPIVLNCNLSNLDSINNSPIRIDAETGTALIIINNANLIAPTTNTLGYGIHVTNFTNVHINNPSFTGTFTKKLFFAGTAPGVTNRETTLIDASLDDKDGAAAAFMPYWKPVKFTSFDQTSQPTVATNIFKGELTTWQDDNDQFTGIYRRDDSDTPKFVDFGGKKRLRGVANLTASSPTVAANTSETGSITVTGAALGDVVTISTTAAMNVNLVLTAAVTAVDTVTYKITNPTVAGITRAATFVIVNVTSSDY